MRILAIFPRVAAAPAGGSEHFFERLCAELSRRGAELDCLTTTTRDLAPSSSLGILWDRGGSGQPPGIPRPRRYRVLNVPPRIARSLSARALDASVARELPAAPATIAGRGFFPEETWSDGGFPFRWTGRRFSLNGPAPPLCLEALAPLPGELTVEVAGSRRRQPLVAGRFHRYEIPAIPERRAICGVTRLFAPPADLRGLGLAVSRITASDGTAMPLDGPAPGDEVAVRARLRQEAASTTLGEEAAYALLRGPIAPGLALAALRRALTADVILAGSAPFLTMDLAVAAGRLARRPVALIPFLHLTDPAHQLRRIHATLAAAELVFSLTVDAGAWLAAELGCRSRLLPGGIDPAEFPGDGTGTPEGTRRELGLPDGCALFLWVGRAGGSKRLDVALEALRIARRRVPAHLVACGPGTDAIVQEGFCGLGDLDRPRLLRLYAGCDALVHTSEEESLGLVLLEAWASGRPVIANPRCAASGELVRDGIDGLHATGAAEVAAAMGRLAGDPAWRGRLGDAGRLKVLAERTWAHAGEVALGELQALLSS